MIKKLTKFFPIFGIVLFIYIISRINLNAVAQNFLKMNLLIFALAFLLIIPSLFLKTLKWKQLIYPFKVEFSMKEGFSAWLVGFFVGLITPGRVGDLARAFYLKEKMKIGKALATVVIDRVLDIFVLMILSVIGIIYLLTKFTIKNEVLGVIAIFFFLFGMLAVIFLEEKRAMKLLRPLYNLFVPEKHKSGLKTSFADFYSAINTLKDSKSYVIRAGLLSFVAWAVTFLQYFVLAEAMGIKLNYMLILMIMPTVLLVEILPISFSGLGTRDATLIFFFSLMGLSASTAVSFSLTILIFNYIYSSTGLLIWIKKPIKL